MKSIKQEKNLLASTSKWYKIFNNIIAKNNFSKIENKNKLNLKFCIFAEIF